jgi:hypothetical protein
MSKANNFSVRKQIRAILAEDLNQTSRETLSQLAGSPDIEKFWSKINRACGEWTNLCTRYILHEIAGAKAAAQAVGRQPDREEYADIAERLAQYLQGANRGGLIIPPLPTNAALVLELRNVASALREMDRKSLITRSRRDVDGSREVNYFMRLLSLTMHDWTGHWLDDVVVDLTLVLFPNSNVTESTIRAARKRFARKKRLNDSRASA